MKERERERERATERKNQFHTHTQSAPVPLGTEWTCPDVLFRIHPASVLTPEESFRAPDPRVPHRLGLGATPLGLAPKTR